MLGICKDCNQNKDNIESESNLCRDCRRKRVIENIKGGFYINFDRFAIYSYDEYTLPEYSLGLGEVENFTEIFAEIKKYIRVNPHEFSLGDNSFEQNICDGYTDREAGESEKDWREKRVWWSPHFPTKENGWVHYSSETRTYHKYRSYGAHFVCRTRKIMRGNFFIHPAALTGAQYEELKQLIPGTCRVKGCGNNYQDPDTEDVRYTVRDGVCAFHRKFPERIPEFYPGKFAVPEISNSGTPTNQTSPSQPVRKDITFTIDSILTGYNGNPHVLNFSTPIWVEDVRVSSVFILANDPNLVEGNKVTIRDISFGPHEAEISPFSETISIGNFFRTIEKVGTNPTPNSQNQTPPNTNTTSTPPPTNPNPTIFAEVQQENQKIQAENTNLALLAADLLEIIDKNNKLCDQAKNEKGLNLIAMLEADGSPMQLNDFNIGLEELDENQPLNSPDNQKKLTENAKNKQRKENFANSLKNIWQQNQTKWQQAVQNPGDNIPQQNSESSLADKKTAAIFQIESKQADLAVVAEGKYINYRQTIERFSKEAEIENYLKEVLVAIAQVKEEKKNNQSSPKTPKPLLSEEEKSILTSSLEVAYQKAVEEIENFLKQKGIKDLDLKNEKRGGKGSFQEFLKGLKSPKEILEFVKNYKKEIEKQADQTKREQKQNNNKISPSNESGLLITVLVLFFVAFFSAMLFVWVKRKRRLKLKKQP